MESLKIQVEENESNIRLDVYVANRVKRESRTYIQKLIKNGYIKVNGKKVKSKYLVKTGDRIIINFPGPKVIEIKPEDIPLDIIYEDRNIAIVNKPQGMVVHPANGNFSGTLVNGLLYYFEHLSDCNGLMRPGIVHRLDKDTSGLLIIAKDNYSHEILAKEFKARNIKRKYYVLVHGNVKVDRDTINTLIGRHPVDRKRMSVVKKNGKEAITHFKVLERYDDYTLLEVELETGRTHQIRVHMAYINHPVVGDMTYSNRKNKFKIKGQLLHARELGFIHPVKNVYMEFVSDVPDYFENILIALRKNRRCFL